ncbi:MAG: hypothetical protein COA78_28580 [Blastopirellula sp.]|nr:MAG: hypothetical protein COA78_28580 [Blastopirellula sp.]
MMNKILLPALLLVILTLLSAETVSAEIIAPGKYHGYFETTRWKQTVFHHGTYHFFVSGSAAKQLEKYRGQPLEINVSKVSQPINPGAGLIQDIAVIKPKDTSGDLKLSLKLKTKKVVQGQGVSFHLSMENKSDHAIIILPYTLAVVLVTNSPFSNQEINFEDPDDRAYWYYSYAYVDFTRFGSINPHRIACRQIKLSMTAAELVKHGEKVRLFTQDDSFDGKVEIASGGNISVDFTVGKELLPDDYEVFFYQTSGNLSSVPGPRSKRHAFDVVAKEKSK